MPDGKWTQRKDARGRGGFVVPPFDPFEPPRHGLTFNFANFFSPVRITRGTTLRPRRKGRLLLSRVTLTFSFFSKARGGSLAWGCEEGGEWGQPAMRMRAGKIITPCTPREEYSQPVPRWWAGTGKKKDRVISLSSFLASVFLRKHRNLNNDIFLALLTLNRNDMELLSSMSCILIKNNDVTGTFRRRQYFEILWF